jgi:hypothetical protein
VDLPRAHGPGPSFTPQCVSPSPRGGGARSGISPCYLARPQLPIFILFPLYIVSYVQVMYKDTRYTEISPHSARACSNVRPQQPPPFLHVPPHALWPGCGPVESRRKSGLRHPGREHERATWLSACRRREKRPPSSTGTTSQPRKGDVTGCQFGALGACPLVPGGCPHPNGWAVGAPKPPPVAPGSARNTRSHDSPLHPVPPRCSGPGARLAPGGPAERAGAKTRRELQWGPRARLPGGAGPARRRGQQWPIFG